MTENGCDIGMIGLGTMGRNMLLNMADHGYWVVGYDRDPGKTGLLKAQAGTGRIQAVDDVKDFVAALKRPRAVMMLVPAGPIVDNVIADLLPLLEPGDVLIDGGNSFFKDTDARQKKLDPTGIHFLGVGVSGGEHGARFGPSMMPGGPKEAYDRVSGVLRDVAAHVNGEPCVEYLGPRSAGHYVKMVHNGIEYGLMQLISECYDLMKRGLGMTNDEMADHLEQWSRAELNGYLIEITTEILRYEDQETGKRLVDLIAGRAGQKGTGEWTSEETMSLQFPCPNIDIAVGMRDLSVYEEQRRAASAVLSAPADVTRPDRGEMLAHIRGALQCAMTLTYAQGMALLRVASQKYDYGLNLEHVARIWRGGCIIRAALLEDLRKAYKAQPDLFSILSDPHIADGVNRTAGDLRTVVCAAAGLGIPAPGLMAAVAYADSYRSMWLPMNLIQAQRDCFGAHTYERIDKPGVFHTEWEGDKVS